MRVLTGPAETARLHAMAERVWLLKLMVYRDQFGGSPTSLVLWLSSRPVTVAGAGEVWPILESVGPVSEQCAELTPQATPGTCDVVVMNDVPLDIHGVARFTDLFRKGAQTGGYDVPMAKATLYSLDARSLDLADALVFGPFVVSDPQPVDLTRCGLKLVTRDAFLDVRREALTPSFVAATPLVPATVTLSRNGSPVVTYVDTLGVTLGQAGFLHQYPATAGPMDGVSGIASFTAGAVVDSFSGVALDPAWVVLIGTAFVAGSEVSGQSAPGAIGGVYARHGGTVVGEPIASITAGVQAFGESEIEEGETAALGVLLQARGFAQGYEGLVNSAPQGALPDTAAAIIRRNGVVVATEAVATILAEGDVLTLTWVPL